MNIYSTRMGSEYTPSIVDVFVKGNMTRRRYAASLGGRHLRAEKISEASVKIVMPKVPLTSKPSSAETKLPRERRLALVTVPAGTTPTAKWFTFSIHPVEILPKNRRGCHKGRSKHSKDNEPLMELLVYVADGTKVKQTPTEETVTPIPIPDILPDSSFWESQCTRQIGAPFLSVDINHVRWQA
ncbi:hypothetical protein OBBRIDRAFT_807728 [Obba rivulosa]|uniref:Uncharacterized protein n=1 Tax=Obba rivulosa TaxID=1052685 RepID=A0A8E2DFT6_9APHY|nr:hypothetical protein OBBRIDRAFT_807728 [Obba rivulosa]